MRKRAIEGTKISTSASMTKQTVRMSRRADSPRNMLRRGRTGLSIAAANVHREAAPGNAPFTYAFLRIFQRR